MLGVIIERRGEGAREKATRVITSAMNILLVLAFVLVSQVSAHNWYKCTGPMPTNIVGKQTLSNRLRRCESGEPEYCRPVPPSMCQPKDSCMMAPCLNGGTCHTTGELSYQCSCPGLFTGHDCETYAPCMSSPCLHDGTCINNYDGFTCSCHSGMLGEICDECTSIVFGCSGGSAFNHAHIYANNGFITEIEFFLNYNSNTNFQYPMECMRVRYGATWSPWVGRQQLGTYQHVAIPSGRRITQIYGSYNNWGLTHLFFLTDIGTTLGPYGTTNANTFWHTIGSCPLKYFSGHSGDGIVNIMFHMVCDNSC